MTAITSALDHLACPKCGERVSADAIRQLCACGSPLLARYDMERASRTFTRAALSARPDTLWRWSELLPVREALHQVTLGERSTPVVSLPSIGREGGISELGVKDESLLPTGSFKARGAAVGISRARELGARTFAMPTNGNAGAAWAAYARRGGLEAHLAMPKSAPAIHRSECRAVGADVTLVDGLISDAGKLVAQWVREHGWYDASTLKEPYRIEGKKTMGFEIAMQFEWAPPDVIIYPTGGGVGLIGMQKAFAELRALGVIGERKPRMVVVQAAGCAPIVRAWNAHERASDAWEGARTAAFGINVPKALGDFLVLDAVYDSDGCAIAVEDADILATRDAVAKADGMLLCLEGAATIAAARMLRANGWIRDRDRVLAINTGSPFKGELASA